MNDILNAADGQTMWQSQLPWLTLTLLALPLVLAAWRLKIYPSVWWTIILGLSLLACVTSVIFPDFLVVAVGIDLLLIGVTAVDFVWLYLNSNRGIVVTRSIPLTCSLGVPVASEITVENRSSLMLRGKVRDDIPENFESLPVEHSLRLPPMGRMTAQRKLTPGRRGAFKLEYIYLRFSSPLKLWIRHLRFDVLNPLNVYPDMKQLSDYARNPK